MRLLAESLGARTTKITTIQRGRHHEQEALR
jgi:hypothetical protein